MKKKTSYRVKLLLVALAFFLGGLYIQFKDIYGFAYLGYVTAEKLHVCEEKHRTDCGLAVLPVKPGQRL